MADSDCYNFLTAYFKLKTINLFILCCADIKRFARWP